VLLPQAFFSIALEATSLPTSHRIASSDPLSNLLHTPIATPDLGALEYKELLLLDVEP
jgi:hypothetical protein